MFGLSPIQLLICGVVAVLLFGSRLPSVARSLGKSLTEFRRGMQDLQHEFRDAMHEADRAAKSPIESKPAEGTQGRLVNSSSPRPADVAHDDSGFDTEGAFPDDRLPEVVVDRQETDEQAQSPAEQAKTPVEG